MPSYSIAPGQQSDTEIITSVLREAAQWLKDIGKPLWNVSDFTEETISSEAHLYHLIKAGPDLAGLFKLQDTDGLFWPDVDPTEALYIHKLVVRRSHAGKGLSSLAVSYAAEEARKSGRPFVRLDCESSRPSLRAHYERLGFKHHSDRQVGWFHCSRYEYRVTDESACPPPRSGDATKKR